MSSGLLDLAFVRGDLNLSDMFTKCVGQALFQRFREVIGFATHDLSLSVLVTRKSQEVKGKKGKGKGKGRKGKSKGKEFNSPIGVVLGSHLNQFHLQQKVPEKS